jgi:hypothetical protein
MLLKFWLVNLVGAIAASFGFAIAWSTTHNFEFALFCIAFAAALFVLAVFVTGVLTGMNDSILYVACSAACVLLAAVSYLLAPTAAEFFQEPAAATMSFVLAAVFTVFSLIFTGWAVYDEAENDGSLFFPEWHEMIPSAIGLAGLVLGPIELGIRRFKESRE